MTNVAHVYVTFGGTLPESEIWQCGVRCLPLDAGVRVPDADLTTYCSEVQAALGTWFNSAGARHATAAHLVWVKAAWIGTDGKYPGDETPGIYDYATPVAGATAAAGQPGFTCQALSFTTGTLRGKGSHGRIYPPNVATPATQYGFSVATATSTALATATVALLNALSNATGTIPVIPAVVPMGPGVSTTDEYPITGVKIGSVVDTIRRRKSAVPEVYQTASL